MTWSEADVESAWETTRGMTPRSADATRAIMTRAVELVAARGVKDMQPWLAAAENDSGIQFTELRAAITAQGARLAVLEQESEKTLADWREYKTAKDKDVAEWRDERDTAMADLERVALERDTARLAITAGNGMVADARAQLEALKADLEHAQAVNLADLRRHQAQVEALNREARDWCTKEAEAASEASGFLFVLRDIATALLGVQMCPTATHVLLLAGADGQMSAPLLEKIQALKTQVKALQAARPVLSAYVGKTAGEAPNSIAMEEAAKRGFGMCCAIAEDRAHEAMRAACLEAALEWAQENYGMRPAGLKAAIESASP